MRFNDKARELVHNLKYRDRHDMAEYCARLMANAAPEYWEQGAVIVPVPLHWRRHLSRRYNQAGLLAKALARETGLPAEFDLVRRIKPTQQQVGLSAMARAKNVRGAFALNEGALERLIGRRVVLVDDVMTQVQPLQL